MLVSRPGLAALLQRTGATEVLLRAQRRIGSPWLPVLTYHRVTDPASERDLDSGVIDVTPEQLDEQVEQLSRYFTFVDTWDLKRFFEQGVRLPRRPVMITFDDGYRDNLETALPILLRHHARAVFFITTRHITDRRLFWWDKAAYIVVHSRKPSARLTYPTNIELDLRHDRERAMRTVLLVIKERYQLDVERFLDELRQALDVPLDATVERTLADSRLMTWDGVRELKRAGMDVQSHTSTHRVLHTVSQGVLMDELAGSREDLKRELGEQAHAVSYPLGHWMGRLPVVERAARAAGYSLGFTNGTGASLLGTKTNPYDLRRIAMSVDYSLEHFRAMMALPPVSYPCQ